MKRTRFSEEQIIGVLKEAEAGAKTADLARRHGVSEATIYNWKSKYGGLFDRASAFALMPELDDILRDACGRSPQPACATKDGRRSSFASVSPDGRFKMPRLVARSLDLNDGGRILFEICDTGVLVRRAE